MVDKEWIRGMRTKDLMRMHDTFAFAVAYSKDSVEKANYLSVVEMEMTDRGIRVPRVKNSKASLLRLKRFYENWLMNPRTPIYDQERILGKRNAIVGVLIKRGALKPTALLELGRVKALISQRKRKIKFAKSKLQKPILARKRLKHL